MAANPFNWLARLILSRSRAEFSILKKSSALEACGWYASARANSAVNARGDPIPWITYPAIEFLQERVRPDWDVFEYGSGNSTRWYAARSST